MSISTDERDRVAVTVRTAQRDDAPTLAELAGQLGYLSTANEIIARLDRIEAHSEGAVLVAEVAEVGVCGWVLLTPVMSLTSPAYAEIAGLVVDERMRSSGIGAALVRAAESWAHNHGFNDLRVRSNTIRENAHRFYDREGFARIKTQWLFGKKL
jgi:GNAT superfamily N-acetyltransferase